MTIKEITVYEKNEKTYCESCKPKAGKRGTLMISLPDRVFCSGCGNGFYKEATPSHEGFTLCADGETLVPTSKHSVKCDCETCETKRWEQAEHEQFARYNASPAVPAFRPMLTGLFREPCRRCHVVHTLGRDHENLPLCQGCAMLEQAWNDLQATSDYVLRYQRYHDGLAAFAQAVYQYVNQYVLEPDDMVIRPLCGHHYITKLLPGMGKAEILDLTNYVCPECAREIAEFEWACEAEYQASKG